MSTQHSTEKLTSKTYYPTIQSLSGYGRNRWLIKIMTFCPGWVVQLVGASSRTPKGFRFIPCQGTYLGCSFHPLLRRTGEETTGCFSLTSMFLLPSLPSSLSQISIFGEGFQKQLKKKMTFWCQFLAESTKGTKERGGSKHPKKKANRKIPPSLKISTKCTQWLLDILFYLYIS